VIVNGEKDWDAMMAFARALGEIVNVAKTQTADTGKYSYTYADLGDVLDECKRACGDQGLTIVQVPTVQDGFLALGMWLIHAGGGQVTFDPLMMQLPKEAQAYGSALTYARRYQLMTVFRIAPEDDDGQAATTAAQTQPGRRTEAERLIRESIATMDDATRSHFAADFKRQFGMPLMDLPASKHGDALTWSREWSRSRPEAAATSENADAMTGAST
jgi:hypothetical protein